MSTRNFSRPFRSTTRHYNIPRLEVDVARRSAVSGLRAAFGETESPVDWYMPTLVAETVAVGIDRADTSWYDDSVSEDGEEDGYQSGGLMQEKEVVFELEGNLPPYSHHIHGEEPSTVFELEGDSPIEFPFPRLATPELHNTVFELEADEFPQNGENQIHLSSLRRRSFPHYQHNSYIGHNIQNNRYYGENRPVFIHPAPVEDLTLDNHKIAVDYVRSWLEPDNYPEWTLKDQYTASNNKCNGDDEPTSPLDRVENQLRRSLSFTRRRGNKVLARVRPRKRSGSVASFFETSLMAVGRRSALPSANRPLELCEKQSVSQG